MVCPAVPARGSDTFQRRRVVGTIQIDAHWAVGGVAVRAIVTKCKPVSSSRASSTMSGVQRPSVPCCSTRTPGERVVVRLAPFGQCVAPHKLRQGANRTTGAESCTMFTRLSSGSCGTSPTSPMSKCHVGRHCK
jgi:hypothetical protein